MQDHHILLKPSDQPGIICNLLHRGTLLKDFEYPLRMVANGFRQLLRHEGTLDIPPQHHLTATSIPHEGQRIELAVERPLLIDAASTALTLESRANIPRSLWIRHDDDLRAMTIREGLRL